MLDVIPALPAAWYLQAERRRSIVSTRPGHHLFSLGHTGVGPKQSLPIDAGDWSSRTIGRSLLGQA